MEGMRRWWRGLHGWKSRALYAERHELKLRADLEMALAKYRATLDELNALKEKMALLQVKVRSDGKKVRRRI